MCVGFLDHIKYLNPAIARTILITVMHANNEVGTIQPIEEISKMAKERGIVSTRMQPGEEQIPYLHYQSLIEHASLKSSVLDSN